MREVKASTLIGYFEFRISNFGFEIQAEEVGILES